MSSTNLPRPIPPVVGLGVRQTMPGFHTFRRAYSLTLYGVYAVAVLIYIINHIRKRNHIGVMQVRIDLGSRQRCIFADDLMRVCGSAAWRP
jgi:hypothetical protein